MERGASVLSRGYGFAIDGFCRCGNGGWQAKAGSPLRSAPAVQIRAWSASGAGKERTDGKLRMGAGSPKSKVQSPKSKVQSPRSKVERCPVFEEGLGLRWGVGWRGGAAGLEATALRQAGCLPLRRSAASLPAGAGPHDFFTNGLTREGGNARILLGLGAAGQKGRAGVIGTSSRAGRRRGFFDNLNREVRS